jgi:hypothetical protein
MVRKSIIDVRGNLLITELPEYTRKDASRDFRVWRVPIRGKW